MKQGNRIKRNRTRSGSLTPLQMIEEAIPIVLEALGGEARAKEVVRRVGWLLSDDWSDPDRRQLSSGQWRWASRVRAAGHKLRQEGVLDWSVPWGVWRLTEQR